MSKITDKISELARPEAEKFGCELWDVEYVKEAGARYLRIYIDKPGGVSINDCEAVSRAMDPILDEADLISESYTFEVSSAGADRELRRPSDFERFMGCEVELRHYEPVNGAKSHVGILKAWDNGDITVESAGHETKYVRGQVAQVRLYAGF